MNNFDKYLEEKTKPKNILLIEDDVYVLDIFTLFSKRYNCELTTARTGKVGIELIEKIKFDTVFLDLGLPCMPGLDVFRQIKQKCSKVPVAIISGYLDTKIIEEIHNIGFAVFILKPRSYNEEFFDSLFEMFNIKKLPFY